MRFPGLRFKEIPEPPRVLLDKFLDHGGRLVFRIVVYDEDFPRSRIREPTSRHTLQSRAQAFATVIGTENDGDSHAPFSLPFISGVGCPPAFDPLPDKE